MTLLLGGFAAFFTVQLVKVIFHPNLQDRSLRATMIKMVLALGASFGAAALLIPHNHPRELVVYGFAGAGLSVLIHKIVRLASVAGDGWITGIFQNRRR